MDRIKLAKDFAKETLVEHQRIRDTKLRKSKVGDCKDYEYIVVWIQNELDQDVSVTVKGNYDKTTLGGTTIASAFTVSANSTKTYVVSVIGTNWLPYIWVEYGCSTAPTEGSLSIYLLKRNI